MRTQTQTIWHRMALAILALITIAGCSPQSADREMILATTTSTQDTGLLDKLIPMFEEANGYHVKVIAVGTGQALAMGERGEADAILAHAPGAEQKLVDSGTVTNYHRVMHNDFIVIGPAADPAQVKSATSAAAAFQRIAQTQSSFVSRGDDSGTHKKEKELWAAAGVNPAGRWYIESGSGMGRTLLIASDRTAHTLTDRGTYLAQRPNLHLSILRQGDPGLLNIYHVMQVNPARFTKVNGPAGEAFVRFFLSPQTQQVIAMFGVDQFGEPLFFADAQGS